MVKKIFQLKHLYESCHVAAIAEHTIERQFGEKGVVVFLKVSFFGIRSGHYARGALHAGAVHHFNATKHFTAANAQHTNKKRMLPPENWPLIILIQNGLHQKCMKRQTKNIIKSNLWYEA